MMNRKKILAKIKDILVLGKEGCVIISLKRAFDPGKDFLNSFRIILTMPKSFILNLTNGKGVLL